MKYYKDNIGNVFAYEDDGSQDHLIKGKTKLTQAEVLAHINNATAPSKQSRLASITVTTQAGNTFDGNETARNNMMSAIMAADIVGQSTSNWKMANNEIVQITLDELKEALALSIQRVGEIVLAN